LLRKAKSNNPCDFLGLGPQHLRLLAFDLELELLHAVREVFHVVFHKRRGLV